MRRRRTSGSRRPPGGREARARALSRRGSQRCQGACEAAGQHGKAAQQGKDFLSFKVNKPSVIWIAHDRRGEEEKGGQPPEWLEKEYEKWLEGKDPVPIEVTDGNMATFNLWQKAVKAGKVTIGGNAEAPAAGHGSIYMVLVEEDQNAVVDPQAKLSMTWAIIKSQHQQ